MDICDKVGPGLREKLIVPMLCGESTALRGSTRMSFRSRFIGREIFNTNVFELYSGIGKWAPLGRRIYSEQRIA
jgi:hypothetical protein